MNDNSEQIETALEAYQNGTVGMRGAADMAGISIREMMVEANERNIKMNMEPSELVNDAETLE